jgi:catechol 2,3-dioxygenase-like lactoylglutathione lyase family enzyme
MKTKLIVLVALIFPIIPTAAQTPTGPGRITGAAHMAYFVSDLAKARSYYHDFLGFDEAFTLKNPDGSEHVAVMKINDRQYIKLILATQDVVAKSHGFLHDAGFETADAAAAHKAIAALGAKTTDVGKDQAGNLVFQVTDPYGFTIEIVQYLPDSMTGKTKGKFMPEARIAAKIDHLGLLVGDRAAASKFYADTFGFVSEGDGSKQRVGDGPDRFELGFERKPPTIDRFHVKDHICLSLTGVYKIADMLRAKPAAKTFREIETHKLDNGKEVAELYDLDGNRVELMEPPKGKAE